MALLRLKWDVTQKSKAGRIHTALGTAYKWEIVVPKIGKRRLAWIRIYRSELSNSKREPYKALQCEANQVGKHIFDMKRVVELEDELTSKSADSRRESARGKEE